MAEQLIVNNCKGFSFHNLNEILYFQGEGPYSTICFCDGTTKLVGQILKDIEGKLSGSNICFLRVHKSYLVNTNHIREYRNGKIKKLVLDNDTQIPVATRKLKEFYNRCKTRFIFMG